MSLELSEVTVEEILTRTGGYLRPVATHSLQPYRGCTFGNSLCGVGCYVQHNAWVVRGRAWGSFLEVRTNAADAYRRSYAREAAWARRTQGAFAIFCSSATDPFVPQERTFGVTASVLRAMLEQRGRAPMHLHEEAREAGWSDEELLEAIAAVSLESFTAMINVVGEVPVDGSIEASRSLQAA